MENNILWIMLRDVRILSIRVQHYLYYNAGYSTISTEGMCISYDGHLRNMLFI